MKLPLLIAVVLRVAQLTLEPDQIERIVLPTLGDELTLRPPSAGASWTVRIAARLMYVALVATLSAAVDAARATRWAPLGLAAVASLAGVLGLRAAGPDMPWAPQLAFAAIGAVIAALVVVAPRRGLAVAGWSACLAGLVALALVPLVGREVDGARRWLELGPLTIQVSTLALPLFAVGIVRASRWRPAIAIVVPLAVLALVAFERSPATIAVYAVTALAAERRSLVRASVAAGSTAILVAAWTSRVVLAPVPQVEGIGPLLAQAAPAYLCLGLASITLVSALLFQTAWRHRRAPRDPATNSTALLSAVAAGWATLLVVPWASGDGGIPWLSFGGSASICAFLLLALALRAERQLARAASAELARG